MFERLARRIIVTCERQCVVAGTLGSGRGRRRRGVFRRMRFGGALAPEPLEARTLRAAAVLIGSGPELFNAGLEVDKLVAVELDRPGREARRSLAEFPGVLPSDARLNDLRAVAMPTDGTVVVLGRGPDPIDPGREVGKVIRVEPKTGDRTLIAVLEGDIPAVLEPTRLVAIEDVAVGRDGAIYVLGAGPDPDDPEVRIGKVVRIDPDSGDRTLVVGFAGPLATADRLADVVGIAIGPDGAIIVVGEGPDPRRPRRSGRQGGPGRPGFGGDDPRHALPGRPRVAGEPDRSRRGRSRPRRDDRRRRRGTRPRRPRRGGLEAGPGRPGFGSAAPRRDALNVPAFGEDSDRNSRRRGRSGWVDLRRRIGAESRRSDLGGRPGCPGRPGFGGQDAGRRFPGPARDGRAADPDRGPGCCVAPGGGGGRASARREERSWAPRRSSCQGDGS